MNDTSVDWNGKRVLVLGASGFIGRWVTAAAERLGASVAPAVRDPDSAKEAFGMAGVVSDPVVADLRSNEAVTELVRTTKPHIALNLAGYGVDRNERDSADSEAINALLPARLARALADQRDRVSEPSPVLIHIGSALEYGGVRNVDEDAPTNPTTDYGRAKLAGTRAITEASEGGLNACTARVFTVYGPGEHAGRLLPTLLEGKRDGNPIELSEGLQERDFTYVDDVVEGLTRLATAPNLPSVVNLATGQLTTVRRFVELAARELHLDSAQLRFGAFAGHGDDTAHAPVPTNRLEQLLQWVPKTTISEGVRRTAAVLDAEEDTA